MQWKVYGVCGRDMCGRDIYIYICYYIYGLSSWLRWVELLSLHEAIFWFDPWSEMVNPTPDFGFRILHVILEASPHSSQRARPDQLTE